MVTCKHTHTEHRNNSKRTVHNNTIPLLRNSQRDSLAPRHEAFLSTLLEDKLGCNLVFMPFIFHSFLW
jgi:hypothetical protein